MNSCCAQNRPWCLCFPSCFYHQISTLTPKFQRPLTATAANDGLSKSSTLDYTLFFPSFPQISCLFCRLELMSHLAYFCASSVVSRNKLHFRNVFSQKLQTTIGLTTVNDNSPELSLTRKKMKWKKTRCLPAWLLNVSYFGVYPHMRYPPLYWESAHWKNMTT